jgi:TolA-binding protein
LPAALDLSAFSADADYSLDFNGAPKGELKFAGAYAGDGANPGWAPKDDLKTLGAQPGPVAVKPEPKPEPKPAPKEPPPPPPPPPPPAAERTPDQICQSWFATANNYVKAGLNEKAAEYFTKIVDKYPGSEWAAKAKEELRKL